MVKVGHKAAFAIWVWSTKAASAGVSVRVRLASAVGLSAPKFTVCPGADGTTCTVGKLPLGQAAELQATVMVPSNAASGEQVQLIAKATASGAASFSGSATDVVEVPATATAPGTPVTLPAPSSIPPIPGTGVSATDPAGLFPTVGASPSPSTNSLGLPTAKRRPVLHAADTASAVPLDTRLIGGQLAGLAVLAGAVIIAIARLSLRAPKQDDDAGGKHRQRP